MAYFPLHQLKVPPGNARRAGRAATATFVFLAVALIGFVIGKDEITAIGLFGSYLCGMLILFLAVPFIFIPLFFMLAPAAGYIYADFHDYPIVHAWWFWGLSGLSVILAIVTLSKAGKIYPRRK
ncbi:hypothetical protein [Rariglobus hedericola]|uniref:Uncharacterized protein n=1 Tax=Rariglobus hedericola TaxID=2597822 RepID=A0A556QGD7_9BACT|nr:hypothetical protein [Rariglobus hedericola]TSJ75708.1 hypothetical protein FPL22_15685 [Rariglobus hedericola]